MLHRGQWRHYEVQQALQPSLNTAQEHFTITITALCICTTFVNLRGTTVEGNDVEEDAATAAVEVEGEVDRGPVGDDGDDVVGHAVVEGEGGVEEVGGKEEEPEGEEGNGGALEVGGKAGGVGEDGGSGEEASQETHIQEVVLGERGYGASIIL